MNFPMVEVNPKAPELMTDCARIAGVKPSVKLSEKDRFRRLLERIVKLEPTSKNIAAFVVTRSLVRHGDNSWYLIFRKDSEAGRFLKGIAKHLLVGDLPFYKDATGESRVWAIYPSNYEAAADKISEALGLYVQKEC